MTCASCAPAVKAAAKTVAGVSDATVSYSKATADVTYDPARTNPKAIADAITRESGFKASAADPTAKK
jgi:Cu+-exporting ATPase